VIVTGQTPLSIDRSLFPGLSREQLARPLETEPQTITAAPSTTFQSVMTESWVIEKAATLCADAPGSPHSIWGQAASGKYLLAALHPAVGSGNLG
jgi:hypothetical protein